MRDIFQLNSVIVRNVFTFEGFPRVNAMYVLIVFVKMDYILSNEKTSFVPRDNVILYGISLKFMISQCSVRYYNIPR
jgi:hypothetical protein